MMRSCSMMNASPQTFNHSVPQQLPQKSNSTQNLVYGSESNESESEDDKTDSDFILKRKKNTKKKSDKVKISDNSFLPDLSPYFFKGLRVFVKLHGISQDKDKEFNDETMIKFALEQVGSIIVEDPNYSDLIITDKFYPKLSVKQSHRRSRQILVDQISWIKNFHPIPPTNIPTTSINLSPNSSFKILNRSALSSPMVNNDMNSPQTSQIPPKAKRATTLKVTSPIRHVILPSNSTSPSAVNTSFSYNVNSSINNLMNIKNTSNGVYNNAFVTNQSYIQRVNSKNFNDSYRKIQCLPINPHYQRVPMIVVSDMRHLYAPITKVFTNTEQVPQIYIERAPRFYFLTPFQPVPPNAKQIAQSYMLDRMSRMQNKIIPAPPNVKIDTNDISAVIGKSNYYCYICRTNFDNPHDHHDSSYHIRNTTPLWEEFDNLASSFNEIAKEKK